MIIRFSPYSSPFVPAGNYPNVYWVGAEYRHMPHSAHVAEWVQELGRRHVATCVFSPKPSDRALQHLASPEQRSYWCSLAVSVEQPAVLSDFSNDGIKSASRRLVEISRSNKNRISFAGKKLLAKKPLRQQV